MPRKPDKPLNPPVEIRGARGSALTTPRDERDEGLRKAATAAWHLCSSLLATRFGATDDLVREVRDALENCLFVAGGLREPGRIAELEEGLRESVKLQAHYAKLLNMHDGGERMIFRTADEWLARLAEIRTRDVRTGDEAEAAGRAEYERVASSLPNPASPKDDATGSKAYKKSEDSDAG